jgi:hypothetical protein
LSGWCSASTVDSQTAEVNVQSPVVGAKSLLQYWGCGRDVVAPSWQSLSLISFARCIRKRSSGGRFFYRPESGSPHQLQPALPARPCRIDSGAGEHGIRRTSDVPGEVHGFGRQIRVATRKWPLRRCAARQNGRNPVEGVATATWSHPGRASVCSATKSYPPRVSWGIGRSCGQRWSCDNGTRALAHGTPEMHIRCPHCHNCSLLFAPPASGRILAQFRSRFLA